MCRSLQQMFMNVYLDLCPISENDSLAILKQLEDYLLIVNKPGDNDTIEFCLQYQTECCQN